MSALLSLRKEKTVKTFVCARKAMSFAHVVGDFDHFMKHIITERHITLRERRIEISDDFVLHKCLLQNFFAIVIDFGSLDLTVCCFDSHKHLRVICPTPKIANEITRSSEYCPRLVVGNPSLYFKPRFMDDFPHDRIFIQPVLVILIMTNQLHILQYAGSECFTDGLRLMSENLKMRAE